MNLPKSEPAGTRVRMLTT